MSHIYDSPILKKTSGLQAIFSTVFQYWNLEFAVSQLMIWHYIILNCFKFLSHLYDKNGRYLWIINLSEPSFILVVQTNVTRFWVTLGPCLLNIILFCTNIVKSRKMLIVRQKGLRDIVCYCRTAYWRNFFYVCHLMLIAVMTGIITVEHNYCVLYTLFRQHVSTQYGHHQTVT